MKFKNLIPYGVLGLIACSGVLLGGCSGNATNEPSAADIDKANQSRAAAIDNDPSLTQAQKDEMKKHMSLGAAGGQEKR